MRSFLGMVVTVFLLIFLGANLRARNEDSVLSRQIEDAVKAPLPSGLRTFHRDNYARATPGGPTLTEGRIQDEMRGVPERKAAHFSEWSYRGGLVTCSALGSDRSHHIIHGFLQGYRPFPIDEPWKPLYVLAIRKAYQYDHLQYHGLQEVWQTSREAFFNTRGDCEDHALSLADWLIESGYDARVVLGKVKEEGHAWVVLYLEGKPYLLEATSKRRGKRWRHLPVADLASEYEPHLMFDQDRLWKRADAVTFGSHNKEHWVEVSRYYGAGS